MEKLKIKVDRVHGFSDPHYVIDIFSNKGKHLDRVRIPPYERSLNDFIERCIPDETDYEILPSKYLQE